MSPTAQDITVTPANDAAGPHAGDPAPRGPGLAALALAALGVVYGDIGTSPLYALKECFRSDTGLAPVRAEVLGVLSLVFWTLLLIVGVKYLTFVVRADNQGEGGMLALLALLSPSEPDAPGGQASRRARRRGATVVLLALLGTGLVAADGVITPAISVLGALEGLASLSPDLSPAVVPAALVVLVVLFAVQRHGSGSLGRVMGPLMLLWFALLVALGLPWIARAPEVLTAVDPRHAFDFVARHGAGTLAVLGALVLCVTGAEALYADLGHFGPRPIRWAWFAVAFPALLVNYFGQGALLLVEGPAAAANPFYALVPHALLTPVIAIATLAAVIASQALISGAYSLAVQAIHLDCLPRMDVRHTSASIQGQVYLPLVNVALMSACVGAVLVFRGTAGLASAYGLAVTGAMVVTSLLLFGVARARWHWPLWRAGLLVALLLAVELPFLLATSGKLLHGGWFPLLIGASLCLAMTTWRRGRRLVRERLGPGLLPVEALVADVRSSRPTRVPGIAVFLGRTPGMVPRSLLHHFKHAQVLHEHVVLLTLGARRVPRVPEEESVSLQDLGEGVYRLEALHGYLESPSVPGILARCGREHPALLTREPSYYLGRDRLRPTARPGMARWRKQLFVLMERNARPADAFFAIPPQRVVELGAQVEF